MALTDTSAFLKEVKNYITSIDKEKAHYDKSKCEQFLSQIDGALAHDPAHAQKHSLEFHRKLLLDLIKKGR